MPRFFARHAATLFFPMALILYDFAAYLSTDLIQPGIINVVRDFNADVSLAPAAVSLYLAGGMALQWLLGPLHFVHWKVLFAIIAVMGFISFVGLLLAMPETVKRGAVPFSAKSVLRDFRNVFCNRLFLFGAATISLSYIPMMSWVAVSPVILIDAGGLTTSQFAWTQVPVFGAVIVANAIVARFVKDPTEPRFIWRAVPIQLVGLALLIIGNLLSPHVWLWSVLGTSLYAFGIGLIFPTLFRFTLFSNNLPKGTVSASLNMVILMVMSVSVEIGRWLWFNGGRLPFHLLAVVAGVIVVFTLAGLLNRVRQHQAAELAEER